MLEAVRRERHSGVVVEGDRRGGTVDGSRDPPDDPVPARQVGQRGEHPELEPDLTGRPQHQAPQVAVGELLVALHEGADRDLIGGKRE